MRILKKHIGTTVEFDGWNDSEGLTQWGVVVEVKNGYATLEVPYYTVRDRNNPEYKQQMRTPNGEPWKQVLAVRDAKITRIIY